MTGSFKPSKNIENTIADAVIAVLAHCGDADIEAGMGFMTQEPETTQAKILRDKIGVAAIRAMAQFHLAYTANRI